MPTFEFDGSSLEDLARHMREAAEKFVAETDKTVAVVGGEVAETAKQIASRHSHSIPGTIRLVLGPGVAEIHAGESGKPLARLYEMGNKGNRKGQFRQRKLTGPVTQAQAAAGQKTRTGFAHPVFGNPNVWVTQEGFKFLRPALSTNRRAITKRMQAAWAEALKPITHST